MPIRVGEVIEADTTGFVSQCYELHGAPPFGALVKTREGELDILAVVYNAATRSIDPSRRPIARGEGELKDEDIFAQNPQLAKLIRTEFQSLVVGYIKDGSLKQYLPPRPARLHAFVHLCEPEERQEFGRSLDFLSILTTSGVPAVDELISACLRLMSEGQPDKESFLVRAGKELSILLSREPQRLNAILRRLQG